eukprot:scaffold34712_cov66-Cyclotella_meneghiniana.AAC.4
MGYEHGKFWTSNFVSLEMVEAPPTLTISAIRLVNCSGPVQVCHRHCCHTVLQLLHCCIIVSATSTTAQLNVPTDGCCLSDTVTLPLLQQHQLSTLQGGVVSQPPATACHGKFIPLPHCPVVGNKTIY